jgi:hypothetical protein
MLNSRLRPQYWIEEKVVHLFFFVYLYAFTDVSSPFMRSIMSTWWNAFTPDGGVRTFGPRLLI